MTPFAGGFNLRKNLVLYKRTLRTHKMGMLQILIPSMMILFAAFMFSIGFYLIGGLVAAAVVVYMAVVLWKRKVLDVVE